MKIISHRGNGDGGKENDIKTILNILNINEINGVEVDVRVTKDNKIVLFHDFLINTEYIFLKKVSELTYQELYDSNKLELLDDLLGKIKNNKILLLEIKAEFDEYEDTIESLESVIKNYSHLNIYICSFHYKLLQKYKKKYPNNKYGLLVGLFLNDKHLYNELDFLLTTEDYSDKWDNSKETFYFGINIYNKLNKIDVNHKNVYIICDDYKKLNSSHH